MFTTDFRGGGRGFSPGHLKLTAFRTDVLRKIFWKNFQLPTLQKKSSREHVSQGRSTRCIGDGRAPPLIGILIMGI